MNFHNLISRLEYIVHNCENVGSFDLRLTAQAALDELRTMKIRNEMALDPAVWDAIDYLRRYNKTFDEHLKNLKNKTQEVSSTTGSAYHISV